MIKFSTVTGLFAAVLLLQSPLSWGQQCSDREYATFKKYDAYLDANPDIIDDKARSNFAAKIGMRPAALKDLYFRCLERWRAREPEAAEKATQDALARMAAGGESLLTMGQSCRTLGFRYGHTAARTMLGKKPNVGWDFAMPERCSNDRTTEAGIDAGVKAAGK